MPQLTPYCKEALVNVIASRSSSSLDHSVARKALLGKAAQHHDDHAAVGQDGVWLVQSLPGDLVFNTLEQIRYGSTPSTSSS